jgi:hypothetical protein
MTEKREIELKVKNNFKQVEKDIDDLNKSLKDTGKEFDKAATFAERYGDELQPLTTRMGEAEDRLYELAAAGQTTTQEYKELLETVGQYRKVQISTDLAVDAASTTIGQKLGGALNGVTSGFSIAQGAMGAFGSESEEVEKALLKVQSALAIQQGLQGIRESKRSFIELGSIIKNSAIVQKAYNFVVYGTTTATTAQTIATNIQTGATTATTTATKILRIAMLSLPILAIVAGLAALAGAMGLFGDETETAEEKQAKLDKQLAKTTEEINRQKTASEKSAEFMDALNKEEIINAKNRGASEKELTKIKNEQTKERLKDLKQEYDEATKFMLKTSKTFTDRKQIDAAEELFNQAFKKYNDFRLEIEGNTADEVYNKRKDAIDKANELRNSELEKIKELNRTAKEQNDARLRTEQEQEEFLINDKYKSQIALFKKNGKDTKELEIAKLNEINDVRLKYQKITDDAEKERKQKELNVINEAKKLELQQEQEFQAKIEEIDEANFQAGLQKTMTEEEYQLELVRQKYFTLEELAKGNAEQLAIIEQAKANEIGAITKTASDKELADAKAVAEQKAAIQQQGLDVALQGIGVIKSIFEKSKGVQKAAVIAESAIGIAKMIISNKVANAGALASPANILVPGSAAPIIALNNISTGFGIAANVAATAKALSALGGGGAPSGSVGNDGGGGGGGGGFNPSFNVVGNSGINQLAGIQQQPVKAYITTGEVSTALSLERNTLQKTTF